MNYSEHYENIRSEFQYLDLLKDKEFDSFKNPKFAKQAIDLCIDLCENASKKLNIHLYFGISYNHTFNASANIKKNSAAIIFNLGLVNKLETITSDSVAFFMHENIAGLTIESDKKNDLKSTVKDCCITYLFHHELAHVLQSLEDNLNADFNFQEQYSGETYFKIKSHIYEIDADHFGSAMSGHFLIEKITNSNFQFETMILFNSLTLLLFTIANVIIEFSRNAFQYIYYKENSHPHPFIRIIKCNEQILSFVSKNLNVPNSLLETVLQRTETIISQILYRDGRKINYAKLFYENSEEISNYIDEIESIDQKYRELIRHKSQEIFNILVN